VTTFPKEYQNKVRDFLKARFNIEPTDNDVLESCQSLYYIGKAKARFLALKRGKPKS
jgi:hypothetical protein